MVYEMLFGYYPWPCRDEVSFLKNITSTPLRFPYDKPISEEMKNFIISALTVEEKFRLGWDEVFNHAILRKKVNEREFVIIQNDYR